MYSTLKLAKTKQGIATVTLNRPDRGNAMDHTMRRELMDIFSQLGAEKYSRVLILRGAGRHFCSGADFSGGFARSDEEKLIELPEIFEGLNNLRIPTISIVRGAAAGAGATLAACCDVMIVVDKGFLSLPEVRIGRPLGGPLPYMIRSMGERAVRRYALSGERIFGATALGLGLAHEHCGSDELDAVLEKLTDAFLQGAPKAQAATKAAILALTDPSAQGLERMSQITERSFDPQEASEGVAAFKEKRKPTWYP